MDEKMMDDVRELAGIEDRGPGSAGEARAAEYVASRMTDLGLSPEVHKFRMLPHFGFSWALHGLLCLTACILAYYYPFLAACIVLFAIISFEGDTSGKFYFIRRVLPPGSSRHVIGSLKPGGKVLKTIYVAAHMDAGQMGFLLNPKNAVRISRLSKKLFNVQPPLLMPIFWSMAFTLIAVLIHAFFGTTIVTDVLLIVAIIFNLTIIVTVSGFEFARISPGANDNASGVAVMLDLIRRFRQKPLHNSEIRFMGVGSEETFMNGMATYLNKTEKMLDKKNTLFLVPESCGVGKPKVIIGEGVSGIVYNDPALCGAALVAAKKLGYKETEPIVLRSGGTDVSPATRRGFAATGIICTDDDYYVPNYHWTGDTPENIEPETLKKSADIFEETIRIVDDVF